MFLELKESFRQIVDNKIDLVYVDECCFTQGQVTKAAWSARGHNIKRRVTLKGQKCLAVIGAMSRDKGFIHWKSRDKAINGETFR